MEEEILVYVDVWKAFPWDELLEVRRHCIFLCHTIRQ
jgi:hypothetical protein